MILHRHSSRQPACFIVWLAALVLAVSLPATEGLASDVTVCVNIESPPDQGIAACTRLLSTRLSVRDRATVYMNRGNFLRQKGEDDRALADYDQSIRIDPKYALAFYNRGLSYFRKGEYDRALLDLDQASRIDPKYSNPHNLRGLIFTAKGEFDRAIAEFSRAIPVALKFPKAQAYSNRGDAWRLKGDLDRALVDQSQAISLEPDAALHYMHRGNTLRYRGEFDRAIADFDKALRLVPAYPAAFTGRGLTYEKTGDLARARSDFEKALSKPKEVDAANTKEAQDTARARLAALDSGAPQPVIQAAPSKAANATSIPTPTVAARVVASPAVANQGRRVALVVGNAVYQKFGALVNPQRDAEAVAAALRGIGFETVTLAADATREKLAEALRAFANEAEKSDWAMVYYAGHGVEVGGVNYLIPVDAKLAVDRDVQFEAVPLDQVLASVEEAKKLKLIVLDACRDNPFVPQMRRTGTPDVVAAGPTGGGAIGTRSVGRGLGQVKVAGATLVVYAAKHGQVALDGEGGNSPFVTAFVQRLATPGVEINKLFRLVRDDVMEATAGRQEPYTYGSLPGREDFFFVAK